MVEANPKDQLERQKGPAVDWTINSKNKTILPCYMSNDRTIDIFGYLEVIFAL